MRACPGEPREPAAYSVSLELGDRLFRAGVVTLPNPDDLAPPNRGRELVRRVTIAQQLVGGGDAASPVYVPVN